MAVFQSWSQGVGVFGKEGKLKLWSAANVKLYAGGVAEDEFLADDFDWRPLHSPVTNLASGATGLVAGEILLDDKQLTKIDEQALREEVEAIDRRVLKEIGIEPAPAWPVLR